MEEQVGGLGGVVGYIGELWGNQERFVRTLYLPWV
jgi:hypothetical protein